MAIPESGGLSSTNINAEFGRSTQLQMSIHAARNGAYGAINDASGKRPTGNGQSGYAWSHWRGYNHAATYPTLYVLESEAYADVNIQISIDNSYGVNILSGAWYFFGGTFNVASDHGITIRGGNSIFAMWAHLGGWGDPNTYTTKIITTNQRGTIFDGSGPTGTTVSHVFNIQTGEVVYVQGIN